MIECRQEYVTMVLHPSVQRYLMRSACNAVNAQGSGDTSWVVAAAPSRCPAVVAFRKWQCGCAAIP